MKNRDTPALGYNGSDKSNFLTMGVLGELGRGRVGLRNVGGQTGL